MICVEGFVEPVLIYNLLAWGDGAVAHQIRTTALLELSLRLGQPQGDR